MNCSKNPQIEIETFTPLGVIVNKVLMEKFGLVEDFGNRTTPHKATQKNQRDERNIVIPTLHH